jgi:hypothetical protein
MKQASIVVTRKQQPVGVGLDQGGQIGQFSASWAIFSLLGDFQPLGRFLASWVIAYFGQFLENRRNTWQ